MKTKTLILILCSSVALLNGDVATTPIIYPKDAEEFLQKNSDSALDQTLMEYARKGGTIIRLDGDQTPFTLLPGDVVFPSCAGANNRSQTLWAVLKTYSDSITIMKPHATRYGFDPYNNLSNWNRTIHAQPNDEFVLWADMSKSPKFGWDLFTDWIEQKEAPAEELKKMWDYYSNHYYSPDLPSGTRRVYITFAQNSHIHLYRLNQTNESLEDVVVLYYPLPDLIVKPRPEWNTYPRSVESYVGLSNLIKTYLDFSQLN